MIIQPFGFNLKKPIVGGPNTWYYSAGWIDAYTPTNSASTAWGMSTNVYGALVTISSGGTATKLAGALNSDDGSSITAKLALYTSGGTLVASGTTTAFTDTGSAWREATISASVSAGSYYILMSGSSDFCIFWYNNTNGAGKSASGSYAAMPITPMPTLSDEPNTMPGVRVYVA